ncbi:4Fe-4S dicluster domain-containing protein [Pseudodesulfovibrio cashew]|uniref:4Fe-4S dicluster domain-containing protein n=1 Tax=Pseudodesulfovibrio cashew TaxID=2678688 RepID=A0A6I6JQB2_9BACT|nr:nitroreductase family protein [Pseudodesulfovibrio cashew]QGY39844.1 4Fe-4S dicluster domain-containing protein [Pseudodesulfovibrio cashew]
MPLITIDPDKCNHDGLCAQACPVYLIRMEKGALPEAIDRAKELCIRCGHCVAVCPTGALSNSLMPTEDFLPVPENRPGADEVEALLLSRRSVRGFRKEPIPREQLERLIEVARRAPTASNSQNVSWVMIQDPAKLERVKELTAGWMTTVDRLKRYAEGLERGRDMVLRGGTALAMAYAPEAYLWGVADSAIALTYMELMASGMGLGACWGGLVTSACGQVPELAELMGIPEEYKACGALMLGLPKQKHLLIPPRNPARVKWL